MILCDFIGGANNFGLNCMKHFSYLQNEKVTGGIHHQVDRCLITKELICDKVAVCDNREAGRVFIHTHHWVWDSPHPAHAHYDWCLVHYQTCTHENYPVINCKLSIWLKWHSPSSQDSYLLNKTVQGSPLILAKPLKLRLSSGEIHEASRKESCGRLSTVKPG